MQKKQKYWPINETKGRQIKKILRVYLISLVERCASILPWSLYVPLFSRMLGIHEKIHLRNPVTYDDMLWYIKRYHDDPLMRKCADKLTVREYVAEAGLEELLIPSFGSYKSIEDIPFDTLPDQFFLKCNHGSGANFIYRKGQTDLNFLKRLFNAHLRRDYSYHGRQWVYHRIPPRIIVEEILPIENLDAIFDYRFNCYNGKLKFLTVDLGTVTEDGEHAEDVKRMNYTPDFEPIPEIYMLREAFNPSILEKPEHYDEMVKIAETLAQPFLYCRVDLYYINGKIYFGEITFFPRNGLYDVQPLEWAVKMGNWFDLSQCSKRPREKN